MRLEAFRVQNFKKVRDTGWVSCRDLTVFVGKNEAGKSAVFRGLSKLNPSDGEKYDGLKEFPRRRFTDEFSLQDWPVASGRFALTSDERTKLTETCPALKDVTNVICTRHYSWKTAVEFDPDPGVGPVMRREFMGALDAAIQGMRDLAAPDGKGEALATMKTALLNPLGALRKNLEPHPADQAVGKAEVDQAVNAVAAQSNEPWQRELLEPVGSPLRALAERAGLQDKMAQARKWIEDNLPRFIYFDKYDVIDSAIHIPTFASQATANQGGPRIRTTHCLFKHVGLDVNKLSTLGRHQPGQGPDPNIRRQVDERAVLASSASNAMTQKFADWWEQRKHKFRYQVDGDYFRVWVSDDLDPSEIELDQRSAGMQYFFSFFIVFLVEAQGAHKNAILLLDEPGLHLHGTAQAKVVKFLEKLAKDNQTLYSTHSPFMVDVDRLERARAVYEHEDGTTKVSEDVWPRDKDSLFPLQAALGYQLAQSLFLSKRQLIVEGITDLWLIKALSQALAGRKLPALRSDLVVVPSAGLSKLFPLASMLIGHDVEIAALLDGDEPARRDGKRFVQTLLGGEDRRCLFVGDFVVPTNHAEIEDIFPEAEYLSVVKEAYPGVDLSFDPSEAALPGIVNKVKALFKRKNLGDFEKWKPAAVLRDRISAAPEKVQQQVCDIASRIFQAVNGLFSHPTSEGGE